MIRITCCVMLLMITATWAYISIVEMILAPVSDNLLYVGAMLLIGAGGNVAIDKYLGRGKGDGTVPDSKN